MPQLATSKITSLTVYAIKFQQTSKGLWEWKKKNNSLSLKQLNLPATQIVQYWSNK